MNLWDVKTDTKIAVMKEVMTITVGTSTAKNAVKPDSLRSGFITVGGKNQIPIEGIGRVELEVEDSKKNKQKLAAVKHDFRFNFDRKQCAMQTDKRFKVKAPMAANTDLYQFEAEPVATAAALIATSGAKQSVVSTTLLP
ncbi:Hypothetical protein PHPALM_16549 [Phytophthora palmivora]|uniref:Uncharacterized protein n=1 Tax=Phytophthora palmivora TaxID=4796 RepID=A0A2P4XPG0_9STRA|nr:Hypothetical protein PHPALM_16549 [Phytophthora palmivora]